MSGSGPQVLVAEDDPGNAVLLEKGLQRHRLDAIVVTSVAEMFTALGSDGFDVLVLDLNISEHGGGSQVLRQLHVSRPDLPVIAFGRGPPGRAAALAAGACEYHPVPFRLPDLVTSIQRVLNNSTADPPRSTCWPR